MSKAEKKTKTKSKGEKATSGKVKAAKAGKGAKKTKLSENYKPPIVGLMGHVDHGKTSLLDAIRESKLTEKEFGGITQHISAYQAEHQGKAITFIDTPGHKAFTEMRERGADSTDIIVLVVAADDGVQDQTKEVINLWKKTNDQMIVAINKIDKEGADTRRVKQELSSAGVELEGYGGDVPVVEVSAKKKTNIEGLLDLILLVAEMNGLDKAPEIKNAEYHGEGIVLESYLDSSLGPVALCVVRAGSLGRGEYIAGAGMCSKIRALIDESKKTVEVAEISQPIVAVGLPKVMDLGEIVRVYKDESEAKMAVKAGESINVQKAQKVEDLRDNIIDQLFSCEGEDEGKCLNVIVKCDKQGTLEAVVSSLMKVRVEGVRLSIVRDGIGDVTEDDVDYAKTTRSIVLGFNVEIDAAAVRRAKQERVLVRTYNVIYELIEEVEGAMQGLVEPDKEEIVVGRARVKKIFELSDKSVVAGCIVTAGKMMRGYRCTVERDEETVHEANIKSLKHGKEDEKEVSKDVECGIIIEPEFEVRQGDFVVCRSLSS